MKGYLKLRRKALHILRSELSDQLSYHGISHTLDVLHVCNLYIRREKIKREKAKLLRIGALCHDIGFTVSNQKHEKKSAKLAATLMSKYGFSKKQISIVKRLILATRIPQTPKTYLERILCDADLDYLGRNDYYEISNKLYQELKTFEHIANKEEWREQQIQFLEAHNFHTPFAKKNREPLKQQRILELKGKLQ
jgi:predicted metal-dependent HD superfamily phosphohydrolase